jgi:scyllo-inositol 2-dehydrogenase (NADP+)
MINVAIIGFGLSGRILQEPFFRLHGGFRVHTVVTQSQDPRQFRPAVNWEKDFWRVLSNPDIHLMSICTPSATHFSMAKAALNAGKHVLIEKPATHTSAQLEELLTLANDKNLTIRVFQNRRFDSDLRTIQEVMKSGKLGRIHTYEAHFNRWKAELNPKKWKEVTADANGILYDLGSHILDQAILLFGKPNRFSGEKFKQRPDTEIFDAFDLRLFYDGLLVRLTSSLMVKADTPRYVLHGTKGSFIKHGIDLQEDHLKAGLLPNSIGFGLEEEQTFGILTYEENGQTIQETVPSQQGNWMPLFNELYQAIAAEKADNSSCELILNQLRILEAV